MDFGIAGKAGIVTGGANGIGRATVEKLNELGAQVAIFDRDRSAGTDLAKELEHAAFFEVNVADRDSVNAAVTAAHDHFGGLDFLVNNAGVAPPQTLDTMVDGEWERVMEINLAGPYNLTRAVVPYLKENGGSIVNISSVAGKNISLGAGMHYTTTKWGLIGFSRHMAYELSPYGIRVNIVCPGPTRTALINGDNEAAMEKLGAGVPLGRPVEASDVANAILFFISPLSRMSTGSELIVDGGVLIGSGQGLGAYYESRGGEMPTRKIAEKEE